MINMTHKMHLLNEPYKSSLNGIKNVEIRLFDKKRRKIRVGDTITFINEFDEDKKFDVRVTKLNLFNDLNDVMNNYPLKRLYKEDASYEELIDIYNSIYTFEEQENNKVLAIEFVLI
ncbi:MAG: ASCH domain-containing protein [Bacilli bacterium]|nr:ASCH domain-containing protein [Bacilli bacterium]